MKLCGNLISFGHEIEVGIKKKFTKEIDDKIRKDSKSLSDSLGTDSEVSSSSSMNDYSFNLHEMKDRLTHFVDSMTTFQVYQFLNLNPFLIDDEEL